MPLTLTLSPRGEGTPSATPPYLPPSRLREGPGEGAADVDSGAPPSPPTVMPGLVPGIHVLRHRGAGRAEARRRRDVDARNKSGHDDREGEVRYFNSVRNRRARSRWWGFRLLPTALSAAISTAASSV